MLEMSLSGWIVIGLLFICPFYEAAETTGEEKESLKIFRRPRSFINLGAIVFEATRHNPLDFVTYGNWCGVGGGGEPVDVIDMCCLRHDACYDIAMKGVCTEKDPYTYKYEWSVTKKGEIICDTVDACGETLCVCDKMLAHCFQKNEKSYNPNNHREGENLLEALEKAGSKLLRTGKH